MLGIHIGKRKTRKPRGIEIEKSWCLVFIVCYMSYIWCSYSSLGHKNGYDGKAISELAELIPGKILNVPIIQESPLS